MSTIPSEDVAIRRIKGLLAKAEGTDNPDEAEAFSAKAFELMDKYRIELAQVSTDHGPDIGRTTYHLARAKYLRASLALLAAVAKHYSVVVLVASTGNSKLPTLVGDKDDVRMAVMMFESLLLQRDRACVADYVPPGTSTAKHRNSFCYGYALRIDTRLGEIRRASRATATTTGDSTALELFDRHKKVLEHIGNPSARNTNAPKIDPYAASTGMAAAANADLGQDRIGNRGPAALGAGQ